MPLFICNKKHRTRTYFKQVSFLTQSPYLPSVVKRNPVICLYNPVLCLYSSVLCLFNPVVCLYKDFSSAQFELHPSIQRVFPFSPLELIMKPTSF